jgi:hypothetical protein
VHRHPGHFDGGVLKRIPAQAGNFSLSIRSTLYFFGSVFLVVGRCRSRVNKQENAFRLKGFAYLFTKNLLFFARKKAISS